MMCIIVACLIIIVTFGIITSAIMRISTIVKSVLAFSGTNSCIVSCGGSGIVCPRRRGMIRRRHVMCMIHIIHCGMSVSDTGGIRSRRLEDIFRGDVSALL